MLMQTRKMSSLDLKILLNELDLQGGRIQKIYQSDKSLRFQIFISGKGTKELFFDQGKVFLSSYRRASPIQPGGYAMFLRKYLSGQKITGIKQPFFERIMEIETEHYILRLELFSTGNAILCDKADIIIQPLEKQEWKDRKVLPGEKYMYPPHMIDPFNEKDDFTFKLKESPKKLVIFLAIRCGLSGVYAEEVCSRAEIDKNTICKTLTEEEIGKVRSTIVGLTKNIEPVLTEKGPFPFELNGIETVKKLEDFNTALDDYYSQGEEKIVDENVGKLERIAKQQKQAIETFSVKEDDSRKKADILQKNYQLIDSILKGFQKAKSLGMSWDKIKHMVESDPHMSKVVKEIREQDGKVIVDLS
jgi:predicted ribosome quality control (RQC) complex YloA/Tae2 family protein